MELATVSGFSEAALAMVVLGVLVVAAALLSYFVVAPEYEKRLSQQYAALQHRQQQYEQQFVQQYEQQYEQRYEQQYEPKQEFERKQQGRAELPMLFQRQAPRRMRSLGAWDVGAGSSDDDSSSGSARFRPRFHPLRGFAEDDSDAGSASPDPSLSISPSGVCRVPRRAFKMHQSIGPGTFAAAAIRHTRSAAAISGSFAPEETSPLMDRAASPGRLTRRRKSESDALKEANIARAAMLHRRVLLRKLEEEIEGAKNANEAQMKGSAGADGGPSAMTGQTGGLLRGRRVSNGTPELSDERLQMLLAYPADCEKELAVLAAALQQRPEGDQSVGDAVKQALRTVHDVLALHLSVDHRDMNKVTVFCNSLLKHDGLNNLRALEVADDEDVRALATSIIEKAVPAIWH